MVKTNGYNRNNAKWDGGRTPGVKSPKKKLKNLKL